LGHSGTINCRLLGRGLGLLAACSTVLALGGCGGIEFKGKLFDYAGLSGTTGTKEDPRMTDRAPLLVPPNINSLPPPGSPPIARADWPIDSDLSTKQAAAAKAAADGKKEAAAEAEPRNPYAGKPNLLDKLLGKKKKTDEEVVAVPEPDPSDKTPQERAREQAAATSQKPVDQSLNAPTQTDDPFHPAAPDSYKGISNPSGNNASY
jgi:hypothetical protein